MRARKHFIWGICLLIGLTSLPSLAQFSEGFSMDMNRQDKVKPLEVVDTFVLPTPANTVKPEACPGCASIFLYDEQEMVMGQAQARVARRLLAAPLRDVGDSWLSPALPAMGGTFKVGAKVLLPDGREVILKEKDVEKTMGPDGVQFRLSIPDLQPGAVIQFEAVLDFDTLKAPMGMFVNKVVTFGDGVSPVVRSAFRIAHAEDAEVSVFPRPSSSWQAVNLGRQYDGLSTTRSWQHEFFAPRERLPLTPANATLAPVLVLHVANASSTKYRAGERASTWEEILAGKSESWPKRLANSKPPRELRTMAFSGDAAAKAEALRKRVLEVSARKPHMAPMWFLAVATEKLGGRMVYPAAGPGWLKKDEVAEASLGFPLMAFDGFNGAVYVNPNDLNSPAGKIPGGLGGDMGVYLDPSGKAKWVRFTGSKLSNSVSLNFTGGWSSNGSMSGLLTVSSPTGGEAALRDLGQTGQEQAAALTARVKARGFDVNMSPAADNFSARGNLGVASEGYLMAKPLLFSELPPMHLLTAKRPFGVEWEKQVHLEETTKLRLPDGFQLAQPFNPVSLESEDLAYALSVVVEDGELVITRRFELKTDTVPFERYPQLYKDLARIHQTETLVDLLLHHP